LPLVTVAFHVKAMGATILDLKDTELLDSDGQGISHKVSDGFFKAQIHDVAIIDIVMSQNWTYPNRLVNITVTAKNLGNESETFDVKASILINTFNIIDLAADAGGRLSFHLEHILSGAVPQLQNKSRGHYGSLRIQYN